MKSWLVISFGGVANRERRHLGKKTFGIKGARAPERRIVRTILGRLAFGPSPLGTPGRRIDRAFLGRQAFGSSPIGALALSLLAKGAGPGPMVPTPPKLTNHSDAISIIISVIVKPVWHLKIMIVVENCWFTLDNGGAGNLNLIWCLKEILNFIREKVESYLPFPSFPFLSRLDCTTTT